MAENKLEEDMNKFESAQSWTKEKVVEYLTENKFPEEISAKFAQQEIVGSDLCLIDKDDLKDMGIGVGARVRLLRLLADFKYSSMVAKQSKVLWEGTEWHACPCWPVYKQHYTLTQTALTLRKGRVCGETQDRIDLSTMTNIDLFEECCFATVKIASTDATSPYIEIRANRDEGNDVYKQIRDAWEIDQQTMANARFGT